MNLDGLPRSTHPFQMDRRPNVRHKAFLLGCAQIPNPLSHEGTPRHKALSKHHRGVGVDKDVLNRTHTDHSFWIFKKMNRESPRWQSGQPCGLSLWAPVSIPGLAQWVTDLVLPQLGCSGGTGSIPGPGTSIGHRGSQQRERERLFSTRIEQRE